MELNDPDIMMIRLIIFGVIVGAILLVAAFIGVYEIITKKRLVHYTYDQVIPVGIIVGAFLIILFTSWALGAPLWLTFMGVLIYFPLSILYMGGLRKVAERNKEKPTKKTK